MTSSIYVGQLIASQAFWRLPSSELLRADLDRDSNSWKSPATVYNLPCSQFCTGIVTVNGSKSFRVYYQGVDGSIAELTSEDGQKWMDGDVIVGSRTAAAASATEPQGSSVARSARSCIVA